MAKGRNGVGLRRKAIVKVRRTGPSNGAQLRDWPLFGTVLHGMGLEHEHKFSSGNI